MQKEPLKFIASKILLHLQNLPVWWPMLEKGLKRSGGEEKEEDGWSRKGSE